MTFIYLHVSMVLNIDYVIVCFIKKEYICYVQPIVVKNIKA